MMTNDSQLEDSMASTGGLCERANASAAPYIIMPAGHRQATGPSSFVALWFPHFWAVIAVALSLTGCSSPAPSVLGEDEFVGRPASAPRTGEAPAPRHGALWYRIEPHPSKLRVHLRLLDPPPTATFFLPGPWAGHDDFADRITIESAHGPDTALPLTIDHDEGRLDVEAGDVDWAELTYRVDTESARDPSNRFSPWSYDEAFFAYAPTILVLPSAHIADQLLDIPVEVHSPAAWTVAATWPLARHDVDEQRHSSMTGFVAEDIRSLRDAFVSGGLHWERLDAPLPDGELTLTLAGDFTLDSQALMEATTTLTGEYVERFGDHHRISGLILPLDTDNPNARQGSGRRGGFVLEIPTDHPLDEYLLLLMAHEAFHMWNGHSLVPDADSRSDTKWFMEGVTHYVALKTLSQLGLVSERFVRRELARTGQFYLRNPLVSGGTVRPVDRARLPYDRGVLIALAIDRALLEYTDGTLEVEDWIDVLLSPGFADEARAYDSATLRNALDRLVGDVAIEPLHRYDDLVRRDETIDVAGLFHELGLHFLTASGGHSARLLPIDARTAPYETIFGL